MRGKGRKEFRGITDDFYDISLTNTTTIIKKKGTNTEPTKFEKDPYVTFRI